MKAVCFNTGSVFSIRDHSLFISCEEIHLEPTQWLTDTFRSLVHRGRECCDRRKEGNRNKFFNVRFVWIDASVSTSTQGLNFIIRFKLTDNYQIYYNFVLFGLFWLDREIREIRGRKRRRGNGIVKWHLQTQTHFPHMASFSDILGWREMAEGAWGKQGR